MYKNTQKILEMILNDKYDKSNPIAAFAEYAEPGQLLYLKKGTTLINQKDPATYIYFILKGRLVVLNSITWAPDTTLAYVQNPHILGLVENLVDIDVYTAYVVAETECVVFRVKYSVLSKILQTDANLCFQILRVVGTMTDENMNSSETHRVFPPRDILGHFLYVHARGNLPYTCPLTRKQIATELNINLRSLYRYLDSLEKQERIRLIRGKIVIEQEQFERLEIRYGDIIM